MLVMHGKDSPNLELEGITSEELPIHLGLAKFDLTLALRQLKICAARTLTYDYIASAVAQILGMRVSLGTIAQNGDRFFFEQRQIGVRVVIDSGRHFNSLV